MILATFDAFMEMTDKAVHDKVERGRVCLLLELRTTPIVYTVAS